MEATGLRIARPEGERRAPRRINFTVGALEAIRPPASGRVYVYDTKAPGLQFCVTANGARVFYRYGRVQGRPQRLHLGSFPELSVEQARKLATKLNAEIVEGKDPAQQKREARGETTLQALRDRYTAWCAERGKPLSPRTIVVQDSLWTTCLAQWSTRQLSAIREHDVATLHGKLAGDRGPVTANRAIQFLRRLFNYAIRRLKWRGVNPAIGLDLLPETTRERFLQADELPRFFKALDREPSGTIRDFFRVLLLTGARRSNVQAMAWADVNLERGTWAIPAAEFKTGKPMTVTLSPQAVEVLTRRQKANAGKTPPEAWVFPSHGATGHLMEPKAAWRALLARAGITDLHMHDLRRTLGSWQAATGASLHIIGKSLGHTQQETTQIYARLNLDPVREAVNKATDAMMAAGQTAPPAKGKGKGKRTKGSK